MSPKNGFEPGTHDIASDLPQRLRHVATQLVFKTIEGNEVSPALLRAAADEIDRLKSALIKSALMRTSAPQS